MMRLPVMIKGTAIGAVLLFMVACSSGDGFQASPDATVAPDDLPVIAAAAVASFSLEERFAELTGIVQGDGPSQPLGWTGVYTGEAGPDGRGRVSLYLGMDAQEAGDMLAAAQADLARLSTGALRLFTSGSDESFGAGPCDHAADRRTDDGCAWRDRSVPAVGDEAAALSSDVVPNLRLSAVVFRRGPVMAHVEVQSRSALQSERVANQLAAALDEQIKERLSQ